jgi:hypothetical protein
VPTSTPTATPTPTPTPFASVAVFPVPTPAPFTRDVQPCSVSLHVTGLRDLGRRGYITLTLRTDEPCWVSVSGRMTASSFRSFRARLSPAVATTVRLRAAKRSAVTRALRTQARAIALRVSATDNSGNARTFTQRVRAPRRR